MTETVCIILSTVGFFVGFWVGVFTEAAKLKKWFRKELDKCYGGKGCADHAETKQ